MQLTHRISVRPDAALLMEHSDIPPTLRYKLRSRYTWVETFSTLLLYFINWSTREAARKTQVCPRKTWISQSAEGVLSSADAQCLLVSTVGVDCRGNPARVTLCPCQCANTLAAITGTAKASCTGIEVGSGARADNSVDTPLRIGNSS